MNPNEAIAILNSGKTLLIKDGNLFAILKSECVIDPIVGRYYVSVYDSYKQVVSIQRGISEQDIQKAQTDIAYASFVFGLGFDVDLEYSYSGEAQIFLIEQLWFESSGYTLDWDNVCLANFAFDNHWD